MSAHLIFASSRIRRTPFHDKVVQAGVKAFSVYNHMLFPQIFVSLEEDYAHLKRAVQLWDVACQRQVEIVGPDALRLLQMTTPRDLSRMAEDQCFYIPMVDAKGGMLNDPVAIRLDYWSWEAVDVPIQNYAAWWVIAFVISISYYALKVKIDNRVPWIYAGIQALFIASLLPLA